MLAAIIEPAEDDSDAESVYTTLDGGAVTEERLLDEAAAKPKRRLVPVIDLAVGQRAKAGTYEDLFQSESHQEEPIVVDNDESTSQPQPQPDEGDQQASPSLRAHFDIPVSAHSDGSADEDDESRESESEVWAELEDDIANTAVTPAAFPVEEEDGNPSDNQQEPEAEEDEEIDFETLGEPATPYESYSTPAAYLGVEDPEEDGSESNQAPTESRDELMDVDQVEDAEEEEEENGHPRWPGPEDVDIEQEFAGMFDDIPTPTESPAKPEPEPEPEVEVASQEEAGMDMEPTPEDGSADEDDTPDDVQVADDPVDVENSDSTPEADMPPASADTGETDYDLPGASDTADVESEQNSTAQLNDTSLSVLGPVENGSQVQPETGSVDVGADALDSVDTTVPNFAGLFGKAPPVIDGVGVESSKPVDVAVAHLEPAPTAATERDDAIVEEDDGITPTDGITSTLPELERPITDGTHEILEGATKSPDPHSEAMTKDAEPPLGADSPVEASNPTAEVTITETTSLAVDIVAPADEEQSLSVDVDVEQNSGPEAVEASTVDGTESAPPPYNEAIQSNGIVTESTIEQTVEVHTNESVKSEERQAEGGVMADPAVVGQPPSS